MLPSLFIVPLLPDMLLSDIVPVPRPVLLPMPVASFMLPLRLLVPVSVLPVLLPVPLVPLPETDPLLLLPL